MQMQQMHQQQMAMQQGGYGTQGSAWQSQGQNMNGMNNTMNNGFNNGYNTNGMNNNNMNNNMNGNNNSMEMRNMGNSDVSKQMNMKAYTTAGFTWIIALGLVGALICYACAIFALVVTTKGNPNTNQFAVKTLFDFEVTGYTGIYALLVGTFVFVLEWFQMANGDNNSCSIMARGCAYLFMSSFMFLSYETLGAALYFVFLAVMNIVYEFTHPSQGWPVSR